MMVTYSAPSRMLRVSTVLDETLRELCQFITSRGAKWYYTLCR